MILKMAMNLLFGNAQAFQQGHAAGMYERGLVDGLSGRGQGQGSTTVINNNNNNVGYGLPHPPFPMKGHA